MFLVERVLKVFDSFACPESPGQQSTLGRGMTMPIADDRLFLGWPRFEGDLSFQETIRAISEC